ncbi:MAG: DUF4954 family protein [Sphingobacteriia bacterium]|nr:MAG: DUF4954 family protein [Sphingobacteriia bacterium]
MNKNIITKTPFGSLGHDFIKAPYLPQGKDEFYLRNQENTNGIHYRTLRSDEIEMLVRNGNTTNDWNLILVSDAFDPQLVKNCQFHGLVRIGKLEPLYLGFSDLKARVGLYNSTIISCDFGDNVAIDHVHYLSHYIIGSEVIISSVNELVTTNHAKFGNGIIKEGEAEEVRIWMEICNENTGRKVMPFNGMQPADAWLWSRHRDRTLLQEKFKAFTEAQFDHKRGYYGKIGHRTVIKNCRIIKDVWVGDDAYFKGANKLKNLTVNSGAAGKTQIGEGCEMVNGIIGYGCRAFYGIKAVRFIMADHSQLKYGARLINSFLGYNATISCCEVLNSLIFPAHEQHHNNSFLCAALVMGQSNIAAGATIGSNHNSRSADGEIIMGRGFWPGLCVSLKHNSRFASFCLLTKGDYMSELDIPYPFALVSNNEHENCLQVMPGYWFFYNLYALARNAWKYQDRDKRTTPLQHFEYDYLAPDTLQEMRNARRLIEIETGRAWLKVQGAAVTDEAQLQEAGKQLLVSDPKAVAGLFVSAGKIENSKRPTKLLKVAEAYRLFEDLIVFHGVEALLRGMEENLGMTPAAYCQTFASTLPWFEFVNMGGQLIPQKDYQSLLLDIENGGVQGWEQVHQFYQSCSAQYPLQKRLQALAALEEITGLQLSALTATQFKNLTNQAISTREWMVRNIQESREKDYTNPFRKMVYENSAELNAVVGKLSDNPFLQEQFQQLAEQKAVVARFQAAWD